MIPKNNEIYRHFKGNLYKVITLAVHSESGEQMVVYQALYGDLTVYCRPLEMFVSEVDHEKYPEVTQKLRFEPVDGLLNMDEEKLVETVKKENDIPETEVENDNLSMDEPVAMNQDQGEEQGEVDPLILEFLDAETTARKRNILTALHHRITDEMINTLAVVMDVVIEEGELEDRYYQLKTCLETKERYEIERNRNF